MGRVWALSNIDGRCGRVHKRIPSIHDCVLYVYIASCLVVLTLFPCAHLVDCSSLSITKLVSPVFWRGENLAVCILASYMAIGGKVSFW